MFRKTLIAAVLATIAVTAAQPASAGVQPNGTFLNGLALNGFVLNGLSLNGTQWNGTGADTQPATVIAIELPVTE